MKATAYVFKPAPVKAWRFERGPMPDWLFELHEAQVVRFERFAGPDPVIFVCGRHTLCARLGDWIVLQPTGEAQVWSDPMFQAAFVPEAI